MYFEHIFFMMCEFFLYYLNMEGGFATNTSHEQHPPNPQPPPKNLKKNQPNLVLVMLPNDKRESLYIHKVEDTIYLCFKIHVTPTPLR